MRRRDFLAAIGSAAAVGPFTAQAQQRLRTIGFLAPASAFSYSQWTAAFVQRLRDLGYIDGQNIKIEMRFGEGRSERYTEIAAEFVRLKADVIVTMGAAGAAAMRVTSNIPIVFAIAPDPVASGLVASLARPGGNVTGFSIQSTDLVGKRLEFLREVVPGLRRLAALVDVAITEFRREAAELETIARPLGIDVIKLEVRRREDIVPAFESLKNGADALYVTGGPLMAATRASIHTLATAAKLPTTYNDRSFVEGGGLMSYGPNFVDLFRRTADYVDKILRGAKPGELPVEQPTKFDLVVNLTTAKALGLKIPEAFMLRADVMID